MNVAHQVVIDPGTPIEIAAAQLCFAARSRGLAFMEFNNHRLVATAETSVADVLTRWSNLECARSEKHERDRKNKEDAFQDMLAALKAVVTVRDKKAFEAARAAIRKAEGGQ